MDRLTKKPTFRTRLKTMVVAWTTVLVLALPVAGVVLVKPQPVRAQGLPTIDVASIGGDLARFIKDVILHGLKQGAAVAFKNALKVFVGQIAYDTAVWIGSGDANQKPLLYSKNAGEYLLEVGDSAAGEFLNTLFDENGYAYYDLCKPGSINAQLVVSYAIAFAVPSTNLDAFGIQLPEAVVPKADCSLTDILDNFADASLSADFAANVAVIFLPSNNDFGVLAKAVGIGYNAVASSKEEAVINRLKSDFLDSEGKVSGYIGTPSSAVEHQYFLSLDASSYPQTTFTGELVADTIDIFTSTLIAQLLARLKAGLISDFTTPDITDSLSGSSATSGGVGAAEEKYLSFKQTPVTRGSDLDILSNLANCPDQGADVTNCVIDSGFQSAIEQGLTLRQALDQGLIDGSKPFAMGGEGIPIESPDEGIPFRSTVILKHYRIVPVGWQIAAEYVRDFGGGSSVTLQDLVDAYDQCGDTDYSPYCKLIDPDWVLTSPDGLCNLQGYGQNILSTRFDDDDGLDSTPERNSLIRAQSCVDDRSCLQSDSDGNCLAYGYCTEEKRIYRFQGDECPEQYSSCQTYENSDGNEVSYLRDTLNFNNCDVSSVGCQWYCTVYNDINLDWQCAANGEIYESCSSASVDSSGGSIYDSANATCSCTADDGSTCDMVEGAFLCTTDTSSTCTLGTQTDTTSSLDSAINFNDQVETCDTGDAGCTTFIETTTGANLVFNSSFEYFNEFSEAPEDTLRGDDELTDPESDTFGFYSADSADPGAPCSTASGSDTCIGWQTAGTGAHPVTATSDDVFDGFVAASLDGAATLTTDLETGYYLENRTFDVSLWVQNTTTTDCEGFIELNSILLTNPDYSGPPAKNVTFTGDDTWTQVEFDPYTFADNTTDTTLSLEIIVPAGCGPIKVDAVDVSETDDVSDYTAYGTSEQISMNGDRLSCDTTDIGCELYTPVGGSDDEAIPGQITNPLSDACTGADGFANPDCSLCNGTTSDDEFVGCDFYQEQPLTNAAPVPDLAGFATVPTGDERDGIVQRTGYYCNSTGYEGVSCYDDTDCGGYSGSCVDSISVIPSTADTCSAEYVGCEEYTNLDTVAEGGEGVEYYSYIRQCVKDTAEDRAANEVKTYVTFEGSDVSGYSLRSWNLKKSDVDDGPCTNLDLYDSTSQTSTADCIDSSSTQQTCTAADVGVDADCTEYIDPDDGTSYYRLASYTITATDDCHGLRNNLDGRTYFSVPSESTSCPASQNLCREYKGSAGGDVFQLINEDFEDSVWTASNSTGTVEQSSESAAAGGHSMHLISSGGEYSLVTSSDEGDVSILDEGKTYIVTMWMKGTTGTGLNVFLNSNTSTSADAQVYFAQSGTNSVSLETVTLNATDWQKYTFGPIIFPRAGETDDEFVIYWDDTADVYVDNVVLEESDAQYLIKNTAETCAGYEGCQDYTNRNGDTAYIKSFTKLCEEQFVGCEALISTQNSDSPFVQTFQDEDDDTSDDVTVAEDQIQAYVNDEDNYCNSSEAGCTELGLPEIDETTGLPESFTTVDYINDPDSYGTILCQADALECKEFTSSNDEVAYFKDPGSKTCEYRQTSDGTDYAWFVVNSDDTCPMFDATAPVGQPIGPVCDNGTRDGLFCVSDSDCPDDDDTDTTIPHCRSDLTTDDDGDGVADTGWAGTCSAAYSGCTEYQDGQTDNLIPNGDFEEDKYTYTSGATDDSTIADDGIPDYFEPFSFFSCDTFEQDSNRKHSGSYGLTLSQDGLFSAGDSIGCSTVPEELISIDTSKTYTLSANVLAVHGLANSSTPTIISVGLYYYDSDGNFISPYDYDGDGNTSYDYEDYPAFNLAASAETIPADDSDVWLRFSGEIGNRLEYTWPSTSNAWGADVASVLPFVYVYSPSGSQVFVDNLSLTENNAYFYVNTSVDGATEADTNTCNGEIDIPTGCVGFRDVTNDDLTYLSTIETEQGVNTEFSAVSCTIGATEEESSNCRFTADSADSNVVLKVTPDRECAEWLSCQTASITTDENGNEEATCLELGRCNELSDSGQCSNNLGSLESSDLTSTSDLTYGTSAGNTLKLDNIKNLSGYSTVGANWGQTDGTCDTTSNTCTDGPNAGDSCDPANGDDDCQEDEVEQGYYPYENMSQEGEDGLVNENEDLIQDGDFEAVTCSGNSLYDVTFDYGTTNVGFDTYFYSSKDRTQTCTFDDQCRNAATEARYHELISAVDSGTDIQYQYNEGGWVDFEADDNLRYDYGWCNNPDAANESWGDFSPSDTSTVISVIDYDPAVDFENPTGFHDAPVSPGSNSLDLNNMLVVQPSGSGQGVTYELSDPDSIVNGNQYALSFTAGWSESAGANDYLYAGLTYSDGTITYTEYFSSCNSEGTCGHKALDVSSSLSAYAMTITPSTKPDDATSVLVFIYENADTAFLVDNVSMLPVLEVNKALNDIARECRAYPAEDSLQCNYTQNSGEVYRGIHGYCLEHDALYQDKCVTWWPVDVISGDPDSVNKEAAGYSDRTSVYYCAVAKGLEDLQVCSGGERSGALCSGLSGTEADDYCTGGGSAGTCIAGISYSDVIMNNTETDDNIYTTDIGIDASDSVTKSTFGSNGYDIGARAVGFVFNHGRFSGYDDHNMFLYHSSDANAVEDVINLSDLNNIRVDIYSGYQESADDTAEWPGIGNEYSLGSLESTFEDSSSSTGATTHELPRIYFDESGDLVDATGTALASMASADIQEYLLVYDDDSGNDKGMHCRWTTYDIDDAGTGDIMFTWTAIQDETDDTTLDNGPYFCNHNPFDADNWNISSKFTDELMSAGGRGDEWAYGASSTSGGDFIPGNNEQNVLAYRWHFEDGVMDHVDWVVHAGIDNPYIGATTFINYQLNESCALVVQAVDADANTTAWVDRVSSESTYQLPDQNYTYSSANAPYGSIHSSIVEQDTEDPTQWDASFGLTPFMPNSDGVLILYRESEESGSALPLACIGKCSNNQCSNYDVLHPKYHDYLGESQECNSDESYSCTEEGDGLCLGVDGNGEFSAAGVSTYYTDEGGYQDVSSYNDQLRAAMNVARDNLKLIFADLLGSTGWERRRDDNILSANFSAADNLWEGFQQDNLYDEMQECTSSRSSTDYCGIRPTLNTIEVNGQQGDVYMYEGESARLTFGASVDDNQVPLEDIRIMWEGIDGHTWTQDVDDTDVTEHHWGAATSDSHTYSHSYDCDSTSSYYEELSDTDGDGFAGVCVYELRLQIEDHWDFCSGLQSASTSDEYRETTNGGSCDSYDEFDGYIVVTPD